MDITLAVNKLRELANQLENSSKGHIELHVRIQSTMSNVCVEAQLTDGVLNLLVHDSREMTVDKVAEKRINGLQIESLDSTKNIDIIVKKSVV
jgi:hypothetical protein